MIRVQNVAAKIMDKPRDPGDDALAILTVNEQNDGLFLLWFHGLVGLRDSWSESRRGALADDVAHQIVHRRIGNLDLYGIATRRSPMIDIDDAVDFGSEPFVSAFEQPFAFFGGAF